MMYEILYPKRRYVSAATIEGWFSDAAADEMIDPTYLGTTDVETMAVALEDVGMITLGRGRRLK